MSATDQTKIIMEKQKVCREEQFWFTATTLTFNGFLMTKAQTPSYYDIGASLVVTLFAIYLNIMRWIAHGQHDILNEKRSEIPTSWCAAIPLILAECSGTLFYIVFLVISFIGVCLCHKQ